jgi:hypothetical protein
MPINLNESTFMNSASSKVFYLLPGVRVLDEKLLLTGLGLNRITLGSSRGGRVHSKGELWT